MKKTIIIAMFILLSPIMFSCSNTPVNPDSDFCELSQSNDEVYICEKVLVGYFDTTISLRTYYYGNDDYVVSEVFTHFEETVAEYDRYFDKYTEHDDIVNVYTINHYNTEVHQLDEILFDAIDYILTNGDRVYEDGVPLFNIALHPVLDIWHEARNNALCDELELGILYCPLPTEQIDGYHFNVDQDDIHLDYENKTLEFLEPNMGIDLGGFAKGYVQDRLYDYFIANHINYLLNMGNSNVSSAEANPTREDGLYYIALETPVTEFTLSNDYYHILKIPAYYSVVTSGVNQRFFKDIDTGDVYHHIIDPRTNYPGGDVLSFTIVSDQGGAILDILSTSLFLLDHADALAYVNSDDSLEAVWYLEDGTIEYSDNFSQYIFE